MSDSNKKSKVEIMHRINRLKLKAGAEPGEKSVGFIDPKAVRKAQNVIDEKEIQYGDEVNEVMVRLDSVWTDM